MQMKFKTLAAIAIPSKALSLSGCNERRYFDNIEGFLLGMSCDLDAAFNTSNCHPTGRVLRKVGSIPGLDLSTLTYRFSTSNMTVVTLPSSVEVRLLGSSSVLAAQTFAVTSVSYDTVAPASPGAIEAWVNSYGAAVDSIDYTANGLVLQGTPGMNTVTVSQQIGPAVVGQATYSMYMRSPIFARGDVEQGVTQLASVAVPSRRMP